MRFSLDLDLDSDSAFSFINDSIGAIHGVAVTDLAFHGPEIFLEVLQMTIKTEVYVQKYLFLSSIRLFHSCKILYANPPLLLAFR